MNMEKSKDEHLLDLMKMLKINLEVIRINEWRTARNKYYSELHDLLKSHGKL